MMQHVNVNEIIVDKFPNVRDDMDRDALDGLMDSIKEHGILSPLLLSGPDKEGKFSLVYGHRRYEAARQLGMEMVPAIIKKMKASKVLLFQLIENLQREDLSVFEEARAYKRVITASGMAQQDLARALGVTKSHVSARLKMLSVDPSVKKAMDEGQIDYADARYLSRMPREKQKETIDKVNEEIKKISPPAKPQKPEEKNAAKKAKEKAKQVVKDAVISRKGERPGKKKSPGTLEERLAVAQEVLAAKFAEKHNNGNQLTEAKLKFFGDILRFLLEEKRFIVG